MSVTFLVVRQAQGRRRRKKLNVNKKKKKGRQSDGTEGGRREGERENVAGWVETGQTAKYAAVGAERWGCGQKIVVIKDKNNTQGAVNGLLNTGWARVKE